MQQTCSNCSTINRSVALFCKKCGLKLSSALGPGLEELIGMEEIKKVMNDLAVVMDGVKNDGLTYSDRLHTIIMGNSGTGKTTLVNAMAAMYHKQGVIKQQTPIIYDAVDFADFSKNFLDNFKKAKGNILCIENIQKLIPAGYSQDVEQLDRIFREMSKLENRHDPIIFLSGEPQGLREYLNANESVKSKFRYIFSIADFTSDQLTEYTEKELSKSGFNLAAEARQKLAKIYKLLLKKSRKPDYEPEARNAGLALKITENLKSNYYLRVTETGPGKRTILPEDIKGEIEKEKTLTEILDDIDALIGMQTIKDAVRHLIDEILVQKKRVSSGVGMEKSIAFHIVLTGNPGTGKTTIARMLGEIFQAIGLLELGHVIEVDRSQMVAQYVGQTAPQVNALCDKAMGGVLFIDEAYTLKRGDNDNFGQEALEALLKRMEDDRGKFIVVIAGYPNEIETFLNANPGLQSRFNQRYRFHLEDYTPDELFAIFNKMVSAENYYLDDAAASVVKKEFITLCAQKDKNFGNGREARNLFETCRSLQSQRLSGMGKTAELQPEDLSCILPQDISVKQETQQSTSSVLQEIESLIGLNAVKNEIKTLVSYLQIEKIRADQGGKTTPLNLHFVFRGNPGTGKTTVARILARTFKAMGLLPKGHLVEVDRAGLVASYVGQTAPQTNKAIDNAMGGVLFVDEAYTLSTDSFGKEAIDTLLKRMEDDKGKFIVIAAGYFDEMESFLNSNSGLSSRFTKFINFEDYTAQEMQAIFHSMVADKELVLEEIATEKLTNLFKAIYDNRDGNFANGRTVRNIFETSLQNQSARIGPLVLSGEFSPEIINTITVEDIPNNG